MALLHLFDTEISSMQMACVASPSAINVQEVSRGLLLLRKHWILFLIVVCGRGMNPARAPGFEFRFVLT